MCLKIICMLRSTEIIIRCGALKARHRETLFFFLFIQQYTVGGRLRGGKIRTYGVFRTLTSASVRRIRDDVVHKKRPHHGVEHTQKIIPKDANKHSVAFQKAIPTATKTKK